MSNILTAKDNDQKKETVEKNQPKKEKTKEALVTKDPLTLKSEEVLNNLAKLRGLIKKRDIDVAAMTREKLYEYMLKDFEKQVIDSDIKKLDLLGGRIGIQPENVDTKNVFLNLLKKGVQGFYDPTSKKYYIIRQSNKKKYDEATIAHELTHALQDQYFDLLRLPIDNHDNSDMTTALKCIIEGDAKFTELQYMKIYLNQDHDTHWLGDKNPSPIFLINKPGGTHIDPKKYNMDNNKFFEFLLGKSLMYSYYQGVRFVQKIFNHGGWDAVNHLYEDWPLSTEQIIHPEKYLDKDQRDDPTEINSKKFIDWLDNEYNYVFSDVMGELAIDRLIINFFPRSEINAEDVGAGWEGDRLIGFINKKTKAPAYTWLSLWETEQDAKEFEAALTKLYQKHFSQPDANTTYPTAVVAVKGDSISWIQRQGKRVIICDGEDVKATQILVKQALSKTTIIETKKNNFWTFKATPEEKKEDPK